MTYGSHNPSKKMSGKSGYGTKGTSGHNPHGSMDKAAAGAYNKGQPLGLRQTYKQTGKVG